MAPPLIVRAVLDAAGYLKVSESVVSSNTAMAESALGMGADFTKSAEAQVAAGAKVIASQRTQLASLRAIQAESVAGSDRRIAADAAVAKAQAALNRSMGITAVGTSRLSQDTKTAERDLGKLTRGALAGSGVFSALGRSLAFASGGFIAIAGGATVIATSIRAAEDLAAAQRRADQQLKTSGKSWEQYGLQIDSVLLKEGHLAGFTRTDLLGSFTFLLRVGGNVSNSLKLVAEAADIARGRGISLQAASIALSKALGGSATALRRLGIIVPNNVTKMQALEYVQKKFAGQAAAGTTASQRLSAALTDAEATIGTALLPTFEHLATSFSDWIQKMQQTGQLQKDLHEIGKLFGIVGGAIKTVDDITGGFANTLRLLFNVELVRYTAKAITGLGALAAEWGLVGAAAGKAAAAEETALTVAAGGSAVKGGEAAIVGSAAIGGTAGRASSTLGRDLTFTTAAGQLTTVSAKVERNIPGAVKAMSGLSAALEGLAPIAAGVIALQIIESKTYKDIRQKIIDASGGQHSFLGGVVADLTGSILFAGQQTVDSFHNMVRAWKGFLGLLHEQSVNVEKQIEQEKKTLGLTFLDNLVKPIQGPFGSAKPQRIRDDYAVPLYLQVGQAQAQLTASTRDDVAVATRIIKNIKRIIDRGNYTQKGLLALLQAEASAMGIVQSAAQAAAQKAAAAKAAALAAASTYNVPAALQLAQAKAQAYGKSETAILKKIIAAAQHAIDAGGKNWQGLVAAYNVIANARAQLEQDAQAAIIPLKLQLALARAQALGLDQAPILKKMKAALEKALKAAKGNIQKQIDIWNQIAAINQQLGQNVQNAYGDYKKASLKWETEGLGLTPAQRRALEARLSQIGPGGTHPMSGTGAAGYIIDPETGRPIHRGRTQGSKYTGSAGGKPPTVNANIDLRVYIDGKQVEATVTKRQQRNNQKRPTQSRGPHAATR